MDAVTSLHRNLEEPELNVADLNINDAEGLEDSKEQPDSLGRSDTRTENLTEIPEENVPHTIEAQADPGLLSTELGKKQVRLGYPHDSKPDDPVDIPWPPVRYYQWWGFAFPDDDWEDKYLERHPELKEPYTYDTFLNVLDHIRQETGVERFRTELGYPPFDEDPDRDDYYILGTFLGTNPTDYKERPTREQYEKLKAVFPGVEWKWWLECDVYRL